MKTHLILAGAALALALPFAAHAKSAAKRGAAQAEIKCPVMKDNKVNIKKATASKSYADYKGNRYYFCCAGCKPEFEKDPARYAKAPHIPIPKKK